MRRIVRAAAGSGLQQRRDEFRGVEHAEILALSSPTPTKRIGIASFCAIASTTPPLAVPSSLVTTRPVTPTPLWNCSACATAFCPIGAVEHQQHLVRCGRIEPREHALDLLELLHQMRLGVQPPGGVGDQHIDVARPRRLQRVEDDRGGLRARLSAR